MDELLPRCNYVGVAFALLIRYDRRPRACARIVIRTRKLDVRVLVWTLIVCVPVGGEARSIARYRRTYNSATSQNLVVSSFYERFTKQLERFLRDLLDHTVEEIAVSHTLAPASEQSRDVVVADATVVRLYRFLWMFPGTHLDVSRLKSYIVNSITA